jgi:hypothetical protein
MNHSDQTSLHGMAATGAIIIIMVIIIRQLGHHHQSWNPWHFGACHGSVRSERVRFEGWNNRNIW